MIRITTQLGDNAKLTIEVTDKSARKMNKKAMTPFGCACEAIKDANKRFEQDNDHFEYLSAVHFAMAQCSIDSYKTLRKIAKYY